MDPPNRHNNNNEAVGTYSAFEVADLKTSKIGQAQPETFTVTYGNSLNITTMILSQKRCLLYTRCLSPGITGS